MSIVQVTYKGETLTVHGLFRNGDTSNHCPDEYDIDEIWWLGDDVLQFLELTKTFFHLDAVTTKILVDANDTHDEERNLTELFKQVIYTHDLETLCCEQMRER